MSTLPVMHPNWQLLRQALVQTLEERFKTAVASMQTLEHAFQARALPLPPIDHFAIIDLPGKHSGIPMLKAIFSALGWYERGAGYLESKQNDFVWLAPPETRAAIASEKALPQVVIADFRVEKLPLCVASVIERYAAMAKPFPFAAFHEQLLRLAEDKTVLDDVLPALLDYFRGRSWPLPSHDEFTLVHEANPLLAWVLVHGPCLNHVTLAMHLQQGFGTFADFLHFLTDDLGLLLNQQEGVVKGSPAVGIEQASTKDVLHPTPLHDQTVLLPQPFVEFVWRYPLKEGGAMGDWHDYFTGFIADQANHVVESLVSFQDEDRVRL